MANVAATRSNLALQAYEHIHRKLSLGELPVGSKLPEVALAQEIGVSRTPVREAVAQLESEGFLVQIPNTGSFVRLMERDELNELFGFRMHLESYALELVMQLHQDKLIEHLHRICDRMLALLEKHRNPNLRKKTSSPFSFGKDWHQLDSQFHELLLESAQNRWIHRVSGQLHLMSRIFIPGRAIGKEEDALHRATRTCQEHQSITQAIKEQNLAMGQRVLKEHIDHGRREAIAFLDWVEEHIHDKPAQRRTLPPELGQMLENIIRLRQVMAENASYTHRV